MKRIRHTIPALRAFVILILLEGILYSGSALAANRVEELTPEATSNLAQYLNPELLEMVFPNAERYGEIEGVPPSSPVFKGDTLLGYVFETYDLVRGVGFSKAPFHILVGMDLAGIIQGVRLVHHVEPIAILGRTDEDFHQYLTQFPALDIRKGVNVVIAMSGSPLEAEKFSQRTTSKNAGDLVEVDAVSRTTTSSVVFSDAIVRSARLIARNRGIKLIDGRSVGRTLDIDQFSPMSWPEMIVDGSLGHLSLTHGEVLRAFEDIQADPPSDVRSWKDEQLYFELYMALVTPAGIGINLLDKVWYDQYRAGRGVDDILLLILSSGDYSFRGNTFKGFSLSTGLQSNLEAQNETGIFDRIQLVQGDTTIPLHIDQHKELPFIHAKERPEFNEISLFFFTPDITFNPTQPWRLELLMEGAKDGNAAGVAMFTLPYRVPDRFITEPLIQTVSDIGVEMSLVQAAKGIDWRSVWRNRPEQIATLFATLIVLTVILSAQETIARRKRLHRWVRIGFLAWVLIWMGWYVGAQVSIIHLLNIAQSLVDDFDWGFFLVEPLIFIVSAFVAFGLFLWGRAIFCGWLCPFGALQELLNKIARALKIPQLNIPHSIQERLFAIKYLIFLSLLGLTFYSFDLAIAGTQVEPFKAAITFRFNAPWPAVTYAIVLLGIGLFVERFYCRFMCPLGAGLSILGRVRMFDWLKRRVECGNPCTRCETVCPVGAINPSGRIDMNECFYCLDCQVMYYDDHQCPPLIARRKRNEQASGSNLNLELPTD